MSSWRSAPGASTFDDLVREATRERELVAHEDVTSFMAAMGDFASNDSTVTRAVLGATAADRLGYAFVAGYFAALSGLGGDAAQRARIAGRTAVAATEVSGVHPRNIQATLENREGIGLALRGDKTFVTLASMAETFLVVARDGRAAPDEQGRAPLVAILVPVDRDGVRIELKPKTPFAPEVPHARVRFEDVAIDEADVLHGNGWDDWLKPFRTAEDTHVAAAAASYLFGAARRGGVFPEVASDLSLVIAVALVVEQSGWSSAAGHLALAGAFDALRRAFEKVVAGLDAESAERKRLTRDALLLGVAESARQKRTEVAVGRLAGKR